MVDEPPKQITCDFEIAIHNAVRAVYPKCSIAGCLFHFAQIQRRKVADMQLTEELKTDLALGFDVKLLRALAFDPVNYIQDTFEYLVDLGDPRLEDLLTHIKKNYVGTRLRGKNHLRYISSISYIVLGLFPAVDPECLPTNDRR